MYQSALPAIHKSRLPWAWLAVVLALSGCVNQRIVNDAEERVAAVKSARDQSAALIDKQKRTQPKVETSPEFWLGRPKPVADYEEKLPELFKKRLTLIRAGRYNITTFGERVTRETGIPVRIGPDVFINPTALIPGGATAIATPTALPGGTVAPLPPLPGGAPSASIGNAQTSSNFDTTLEMNFDEPLDAILDRISARLGISWKYEEGAIHLYRFVTKQFTFRGIPGTADTNVTVGRSGSSSTGTTGGAGASASTGTFSSSNNTATAVKLDVWTNLIDQIKTALTPLGKLASSPSSGSITVTDSRATVERIGKIIDDENIKILRAVRIQVEVYSVTTNDNAENGIDWNVVFQRVANGNPDVRFSAISPATLVSALVGSFTSTVQGGPGGTRALAGSTSVISALAQFGRVATVTRTAVSAGNNQPATFAVTNQTGYIAATTPATATAGGTGGVPGLTPGTVTTGFLLNMIPSIVDSRRILLNFSVDISELSRLQNFTSGAGATAQTVQTPEVSSFQVLNRSPVALGETLVLNLFERTNNQYDRRGLTEGSATSFSGRGRRETVVMFLTPVLIYDQI